MTKFRKGQIVRKLLRGAGVTTEEEVTVLAVRKGQVWLDNGRGNDPDGPYAADTGRFVGDSFGGFVKNIAAADQVGELG